MTKLEQEVELQKKGAVGLSVAEQKRKQAADDKYMMARRSFRIWPIIIKQNESAEVCVRRFFILNMKVPADLARTVEATKNQKYTTNIQLYSVTLNQEMPSNPMQEGWQRVRRKRDCGSN